MLVLINFLPLVNLVSQLLFDGCVACVDAATAKRKPGKPRRPSSLSKPPSKRVKGTAASAASAASGASGATDVSSVHLTAQQVRAVRLAQRRARAPTGESFGERLRRLGSTVVNLGATQERAQLLPQNDTVSPPPPPEASWA